MESLALLVTILISPAMFGGPLAFLLTLWRREKISSLRRILIYSLSTLSLFSGALLVYQNVSKGGLIVGLIGISSAVFALFRVRSH
ncbi:MAG: hypothetical protein ACKN8W_02050 [Actinomycetales bacterium]